MEWTIEEESYARVYNDSIVLFKFSQFLFYFS